MNEKLKKSPLTYVLAQVTFSEILGMKEYIPKLQKVIRQEFSEYREQEIKGFDLAKRENRDFNIWYFFDEKFTTGIIVTTNTITIHASEYCSFEKMMEQAKEVFNKFKEIVQLKLYSRIGLRYVNLIHDKVRDCLKQELLGYPLESNNVFKNIYIANSETIQKTSKGTIKINSIHISDKSVINSNNLYVPPTLNTGHLSFEHHKDKFPRKEYVLLDIDHFAESGGEFDLDRIEKQFEDLHDGVYQAFCSITKKTARKKWK